MHNPKMNCSLKTFTSKPMKHTSGISVYIITFFEEKFFNKNSSLFTNVNILHTVI